MCTRKGAVLGCLLAALAQHWTLKGPPPLACTQYSISIEVHTLWESGARSGLYAAPEVEVVSATKGSVGGPLQAGAKHVYGIERSAIAEQAKQIVADNGYTDRVTIIQGKVEETELPVDKVRAGSGLQCLPVHQLLAAVPVQGGLPARA